MKNNNLVISREVIPSTSRYSWKYSDTFLDSNNSDISSELWTEWITWLDVKKHDKEFWYSLWSIMNRLKWIIDKL